LTGIVTPTLMIPTWLAVTVTVPTLQTLMLTFAPALNPLPLIVSVPPGTTVLGEAVSFPVQLAAPGG